jgi:predicted acetyltransferase
MIRLANSEDKSSVRRLWKICFDDDEDFMHLYFTKKYADENTLIYTIGNEVVASLQMLPYGFTFCEEEILTTYISGACTLPEHRHKGYMGQLLMSAFEMMQQRNIALSMLIPAEDWLYNYYARYGYERVFDADESSPIQLKDFIEQADGNLERAYAIFDSYFRPLDFCIQKTEDDFLTILKDAELMDFPVKMSLSGMARIIDAQKLLELFAQKHSDSSPFSFNLDDKQLKKNNGFYEICNGHCIKKERNALCKNNLLSVNDLCRLLFGHQLETFNSPFAQYFEPQKPILNLMLE